MKAQIISELRKLRTTRTTWTVLAALLALLAFGIGGVMWHPGDISLTVPLVHQPFLNLPMSVASVFVLILGLRSFTDEFRHRSIVPTLLATPDRRRVLAAKLVAMGVVAVVFAAASTALSLAIGIPWLVAKGIAVGFSFGSFALWFGELLLTCLLWASVGVGVGLAVRHQVAAIVGSILWITVGENLLGGIVPKIARFLPSSAGQAIGSIGGNVLSPAAGALMLAAWAAAAVVIGAAIMERRDIA
jgi:ABC-type transport system involved in multi-copper enzyme maturation permease subunit